MSKKTILAKVLYNIGTTKLMNAYWGASRLTVLAYHRILDVNTPGFDFYEPNVSASPTLFAREMAYVAQHFNVVDLKAVVDFVYHKAPLPERPLLITFDDGYLDNYQNALPVLKKYGFPAVIFLMTHWMTHTHERSWWDKCAYYFYHTRKDSAELPLVGLRDLSTPQARRAAREALMPKLKLISEQEKLQRLAEIGDVLGIPQIPQEQQIFVTWEQVRELVANRVACQPHTVNHPILTRVSDAQVEDEICLSRQHVQQETGQDILGFAYPNGGQEDYSIAALNALRKYDYKVAFTLAPGPMPAREVQNHPFEIRRVYLGQKDTFESFVLKVMGASMLNESLAYVEQ